MQISYCNAECCGGLGTRLLGGNTQSTVMYWIPAVVYAVVYCGVTASIPLPFPSLPLFPFLSHYTTDLWSLQVFCTFGTPVVKCLWKRIPEAANALFGKYPLHIVLLVSFPGSFPAAEMLWRSLGMRLQCYYSCIFTVVLFLGSRITELCHLWTVKTLQKIDFSSRQAIIAAS